jgi:hypothetical protein
MRKLDVETGVGRSKYRPFQSKNVVELLPNGVQGVPGSNPGVPTNLTSNSSRVKSLQQLPCK